MKKILFLLNFLIFPIIATTEIKTNYKIIYFVSPPRSMSTAFLRMMEARGDFTVINEPSWYAFDLTIFKPEQVNHLFKKGHPATFKEVKEQIYTEAKKSNVFVKEISFAVAAFLLEDDEFIKNPNVHFVFLLRDPHAALLSFYKKQMMDIPLEKFGYRGCWFIFEKVKNEGANQPVIILSEDLSTKPEETISIFCHKVGIPFISESLQWKNLGDNFDGEKNWHDGKIAQELYHWHSDAIHSTGFGAISKYKVDAEGRPTFEEIINEKDRLALLSGYDVNLSFYNLLLAQKQYICRNYSVTAQDIKVLAQDWSNKYVSTLSLEHSWMLANYLYLQYAAISEQILSFQQSHAIKNASEKFYYCNYKNDAQLFTLADQLNKLFEDFKKNMNQYEIQCKLLESCIREIMQSGNKELQEAIDILQSLGINLIALIVEHENSIGEHILTQGYTTVQSSLDKLQLSAGILQSIVDRKRSPHESASCRLDLCLKTTDFMHEYIRELETAIITIQSLSMDRVALNKAVIHIFYKEIYNSIIQTSHLPIPLMFDLKGIMPLLERRDFLPLL